MYMYMYLCSGNTIIIKLHVNLAYKCNKFKVVNCDAINWAFQN